MNIRLVASDLGGEFFSSRHDESDELMRKIGLCVGLLVFLLLRLKWEGELMMKKEDTDSAYMFDRQPVVRSSLL